MVEEGVPHERMVAFGVLFGKPDVLVHVERNDILEGDLSGLVQRDQLFVCRQRGRTRRQSQYEGASGRLFLVDLLYDVARCPAACVFLRVFDNQSHRLNG